jgi:hypothetical protein
MESDQQAKRPPDLRRLASAGYPFGPVGDSHTRRVRSGVWNLSARQPGIRIDLEGDGDQCQYKNADKGSHGQVYRGQLRQNQPNKPPKKWKFHF